MYDSKRTRQATSTFFKYLQVHCNSSQIKSDPQSIKPHLHVQEHTRKKQQAKRLRAGAREGARSEGDVRGERRKQGFGNKDGRRTWAGEMSSPLGGRSVLSTANRRGKHLQDKQSARYLRERWHCRQQEHRSITAATDEELHSNTPRKDPHHILLTSVLTFLWWYLLFEY